MDTAEARLVAAAKAGSQPAFAALVRAHQQAVRGFLRRLRADPWDADDLAQDAFVAAWRALPKFDGRSSFRSWVCAIAWRRQLADRRGAARRRLREESWAGERSTVETPTTDARLDAASLLRGLPEEQRAVVALCLAADFSHSEAAAALGLPLGTVKSHVTRGRARLAQILGDGDEQ